MNAPVYAYRRGPPHARAKRQTPEHSLQVAVVEYLTWALPDGFIFTASAAGARMSMKTANTMKAAGQRPGWPDIMILGPGGGFKGLELKAEAGVQSAAQKAFAGHCERSGQDMYAICRTVEEVESALVRWGVKPKCGVAAANRYRGGV